MWHPLRARRAQQVPRQSVTHHYNPGGLLSSHLVTAYLMTSFIPPHSSRGDDRGV